MYYNSRELSTSGALQQQRIYSQDVSNHRLTMNLKKMMRSHQSQEAPSGLCAWPWQHWMLFVTVPSASFLLLALPASPSQIAP